RGGNIVEEMDRSPAEFSDFLDRLSGEFWRCNIEENVGPRRFEVDGLRIDCRVGGLVGHLGYDPDVAVEPVLQPLQLGLSVIISLVKDTDCSLRVVLQ